jgi:hypothetical protein
VYAFIVCLILVGIVCRLTTRDAYCNPAAVIVDSIVGGRVRAQRAGVLVGRCWPASHRIAHADCSCRIGRRLCGVSSVSTVLDVTPTLDTRTPSHH